MLKEKVDGGEEFSASSGKGPRGRGWGWGWERQLVDTGQGFSNLLQERKEENNVDAQETASHLGMPHVTVLLKDLSC